MDSIDLKDYYPRGSYLDGVYAHYSSLHAHCQWAAFVHIISDTTELYRLDLGLSSATAPRLISEPQRQLKAPAHSDHPNSRLPTLDSSPITISDGNDAAFGNNSSDAIHAIVHTWS